MFLRLDILPTWIIEEAAWQPERNAVWESLFTLANGYLGVRGFPEEQFDAGPTQPGIYIAGVFNPGADGIPELVNVTNFLAVEIKLEEQPFRMAQGSVAEYRRMLGLKRGLLQRSMVYTANGRSTRLEFERFVSVSDMHSVGQSLTITPLDWRGKVSVGLWFDARVSNQNKRHLRFLHSEHMGRDRILLATQTDRALTRIVHACRCVSWVHQQPPPKPRFVGSGEMIGLEYQVTLERGQQAAFDRIITTHTSKDPETISAERCCLESVRGPEGGAYGVHRRRHVEAWQRRWEHADITIDGPDDDQRAIRFSVFQLIQHCPPRNVAVSIGAKGLTGEGYRGHVFWDTDIFMVPFFVCVDPPAAKRLLDYRVKTLDGARRKARASGYQGAMFPWESADTGDEACPTYVPDPKTGEPVRVLTGELQHHISADVVYAAWRYVQASRDVAFQERDFLILCVLTARFWASRVTHNEAKGCYEIRNVIGPDEYHVRVDDNAFTNFMAAWNLKLAAREVKRMLREHRLGRLLRNMKVTEEEVSRWLTVAESMYLPGKPNQSPWEQHKGFYGLHLTNPRPLSATVSPLPEKERMAEIEKSQVLKQADVLMLTVLFPDVFSMKAKRANWEYYEPKTTHDSSLSASIHSIAASDLGLREAAYSYFRRSAFIDLHDTMGNTNSGLHLGAIGGTWQAVVRGFMGLKLDADKPRIRPRLPDVWGRVSMQFQHRDRWYRAVADSEGSRVSPVRKSRTAG